MRTLELAEFGTGQVFWSMLWFFMFFIYIYLLVVVFGDIFRSPDLSGGSKALWCIFVIVLPYLGIFVYLIARGGKMHDRALEAAANQEVALQDRIRTVAGSQSSADELARLAGLRDQGVLSETEFQQAKAKVLA